MVNFGEKLKELRKQKGLTQKQLADQIGLSVRTVVNYENGQSYPKQRRVYQDLAQLFSVDPNYLRVEGEPYPSLDLASEEETLAGANRLIAEASAMFSGGNLSDQDKAAVMRALQDAYWDAQKEQAEKDRD